MVPHWFRPRAYRHFDVPVGLGFAKKASDPSFVVGHAWSPLISYVKRTKRYKPDHGKTVFKDRTIMYASHRDACILSRYGALLTEALDAHYATSGLDRAVIAYRKLGKSNYDFAAEALAFARTSAPCVVICFDISGFFDNLDHRVLKVALAGLLGGTGLEPDWFAVFKAVTRYRNIELVTLAAHSTFGPRVKERSRKPIATIAEVILGGIAVQKNPNAYGIPQGTPISAALSNAYMLKLDAGMVAVCDALGGLYQRYSDDILIVCSTSAEAQIVDALKDGVAALKLEINDEKTDRTEFDAASPKAFQYLGFLMSPKAAVIRQTSLAKQWRKAKRNIRRAAEMGQAAIEAGTATKTFTRKLRRRFMPVGVRNFSSYARRSAKAFGSKQIVRQVLRLERRVDQAIRGLK